MMDLTVNFVWIGTRPLGWLECMMIYSWRMWGCRVNLFSHLPNSSNAHTLTSLGLPENIVTLHDLPTVVGEGSTMDKTRAVLTRWFASRQMPTTWNEDAQKFTFNMADLCKSYLASTQVGIVMDLKIGPSPHIKRYVDSGVFHDKFIGMRRVKTVENQLMGSMAVDNTRRAKYGAGFEHCLFTWPTSRTATDMIDAPFSKWYPEATAANNRALGQSKASRPEGLQGDWFDIGKYGETAHRQQLQIGDANFVGIANEKEYGAVRVYKREDDQTNKTDERFRTTDEQRLEAQRLAFSEMASASIGDSSPVDVTAEGMPPISDLLAMLDKTKKR